MVRSMGASCVLAIVLCVSGGLFGQQDEKSKGTLPQGWGKLGLSDEQKTKIYSIQADYKGKIQELQAKVKDLEKAQRSEMSKVLSAEQKTKLKEMISTKAGEDPPKKVEKKKDDKKNDKNLQN